MQEPQIVKAWVHEYTDYLLHLAIYKTNDRKLSEDLVQDTFVAALESIAAFKGKSSPKTWLVSILKNKILDHFRKEARIKTTALSEAESQPEHFSGYRRWKREARPNTWNTESEKLMDDPEFQRVLKTCLAYLPSNHEAVLRLKFLERVDSEEICQDLDISPSNYWQLLHRAKVKLRKCMEINWFKKN